MYYFKQINGLGCLLWSIFLCWLFFALKLYYIIFAIIIIAFAYNLYLKLKANVVKHNEEKEKNFEPEIGEVYKVCPYCGNNVKRGATYCPHCNTKFE